MLIRKRSVIGGVFRIIIEHHPNQEVKVLTLAIESIFVWPTDTRLGLFATGPIVQKVRQSVAISESH